MVQQIGKRVLCAFVIVLVAVSSVSSECCDFYSTSCLWDTSSWKIAPTTQPDTSQYPSFTSGITDMYYMYIQNQFGTTTSTSTFYIPSDGTVISFDYFLDSPFVDPDYYFYVEFYNSDGSYSTWLTTINTLSPYWGKAAITCSYENNYCCGSLDKLPCTGTLRFVANVDATYLQALIAIDTIGTTCSDIPTTVTPTTVPPPSPTCCTFETDECGSSGSWYWSKLTPPTTNIPLTSGYFEWTKGVGDVWESAIEYGVSASTFFAFQYIFQSPIVHLQISFQKYQSGEIAFIESIEYADKAWHSHNTLCTTCCGTDTVCDGNLIIQSHIPDNSEVAIDNFGRDKTCDGTYACCLFDDASICGSDSDTVNGYAWQFSGTNNPRNPVLNPGSGFVYFETINYNNPYNINVDLRSETITINSDTLFRGDIYIYNPNYTLYINKLTVSFVNANNGNTITQLRDSISTPLTTWETLYFKCDSIYGNCCQGASSCTGHITFSAAVEAYGGSATYAINAFEIAGSCSSFPNSTITKGMKFQ